MHITLIHPSVLASPGCHIIAPSNMRCVGFYTNATQLIYGWCAVHLVGATVVAKLATTTKTLVPNERVHRPLPGDSFALRNASS